MAKEFARKLADYKQMVILRQQECTEIAEVLSSRASGLSSKVELYKTGLIVLGAIVAAKAAFDLAMIGAGARDSLIMTILSFLFLIIGVAVAVISALEKANRYDEKVGKMRAISSQCKDYDRRFMADYLRYVEPDEPKITLAKLESLIDLQNESLDSIRRRCDDVGVDLSSVKVDYRVRR